MFQVLDLFSGIGGFSLGLESTGGFDTVAFCECDKKARLVLDKHWPDVPKYKDVKELTLEQLRTDGIVPDVIVGGFPCQDISGAGKGAGIIGERSGLWSEMFRLIRDVRPSWSIIENVSALRSKGLALVLQDLCEIGYCAEWHCIPASSLGAPHQRDRIWILAYPLREHQAERGECENAADEGFERGTVSSRSQVDAKWERSLRGPRCGSRNEVADSNQGGTQNRRVSDGVGRIVVTEKHLTSAKEASQWKTEPAIPRVVDGFPGRVDRLKQLGNAVIPQIPHLIGKAILEREEAMNAGTNTR
tara:strand:+ start:906 stop:1814 length:909 start_codon:yes stop_codon:yes gene_type:complete